MCHSRGNTNLVNTNSCSEALKFDLSSLEILQPTNNTNGVFSGGFECKLFSTYIMHMLGNSPETNFLYHKYNQIKYITTI